MKALLYGENPLLLAGLVRFLMECDEALGMRRDDYVNPLYAHSPVSTLVFLGFCVFFCRRSFRGYSSSSFGESTVLELGFICCKGCLNIG